MTTARTLAPGDRSIDYAFARPAMSKTYQAGGRGIHRYSAGVGNGQSATQGKLCGLHEIRDAVAAGLDFIANSEWYESRVTEGASAGAADGRADLAFWKARGLARGAAIYVSWDAAPARSKWPAVDAYLKSYRAALAGYYQLGCYAGTPYLRHALAAKLIAFGWRPNAGSWSNDGLPYQPNTATTAARAALMARALKATPAAVMQTGNYWWAKGADENLILRPCGSHMQAIAAAKSAASKPVTKPVTKPVAKPATPAPPKHAAAPHYPAGPHQEALISTDRGWALFIQNDGRPEIRRNGKHVRYL